MSRIIDITNKFSDKNPEIKNGEKEYEVDTAISTVMKFEELSAAGTSKTMEEAFTLALGKEAIHDFKFKSLKLANMKVLLTAVSACMQDITYEEAEARFRQRQKS